MPDYEKWDLVDELTIEHAACLWCEIEPGISWLITQDQHPEVQAIAQLLEMAVRSGELEANTDHVLTLVGDYHKAVVSRAALRDLAESKGQKPVFLFPEERAKPDEAVPTPEPRAQADAPKIRTRLKQFIEERAKTKNPEEYTKDDFYADALNEVDKNIALNMFIEVWRGSDVPKGFKLQGRRPGRRQ